ncbi:LLM class flavin-dependent oxidoreductase [Aeromonas cavernicola]|uniref:LLM class flavin-dependent oxidoreductase n=1 Tax=Aeromonas cavernicola TaxID=1006623 RepID=A0A2H9U3Q7_9GAMM|nr:LLM class flavin-dependent oxidoreductase [Aeromonas cavernicola]PJG58687.1 LLM class flavin-dependent oxidoreductase [Aeromonas cavernicola]
MSLHPNDFIFGASTIGANIPDPDNARVLTDRDRIAQIINMGILCEQLGIDAFAIGESHEANFVTQAHTVMLAALAAATAQIKLFSSVSVLSTQDPVRVYEDFSTLSLLFPKRVNPVVGRGSRLGSYQLFNVNEAFYDDIFREKLNLLLAINSAGINKSPLTWQGKYRSNINNLPVLPYCDTGLNIWHAVGGSPESVLSAAKHGLPMMLTTLAGPNSSYARMIDYYRENFVASDILQRPKVITTSWFFAAESDEQAVTEFYPYFKNMNKYLRGSDVTIDFLYNCLDVNNSMMIGSIETITNKLRTQYELFNHDGFMAHLDTGCSQEEVITKNIYFFRDIINTLKK